MIIPIKLEKRTEGEQKAYAEGYAAGKRDAVRHGRWIGYPECFKYQNAYASYHIVCSVCEECFSILDNDAERFDFCPHCGAKMDEVSE